MKPNYMLVALFSAVLTLPAAALAQEEEAVDNIVVSGQKSQADMRKEVFQYEEDFYALFNKLNDEDDFDVRCFYEKPTGTRIKNHVCRAKFISNAYSSRGRNRNDLTRIANQDANPVVAEKSARFQEKLETLIAENPDLQAALARYNDARARFMALREDSANN